MMKLRLHHLQRSFGYRTWIRSSLRTFWTSSTLDRTKITRPKPVKNFWTLQRSTKSNRWRVKSAKADLEKLSEWARWRPYARLLPTWNRQTSTGWWTPLRRQSSCRKDLEVTICGRLQYNYKVMVGVLNAFLCAVITVFNLILKVVNRWKWNRCIQRSSRQTMRIKIVTEQYCSSTTHALAWRISSWVGYTSEFKCNHHYDSSRWVRYGNKLYIIYSINID